MKHDKIHDGYFEIGEEQMNDSQKWVRQGYAVAEEFDKRVRRLSPGVRLAIAILGLLIPVLLSVTYIVASKPKRAFWVAVVIVVQGVSGFLWTILPWIVSWVPGLVLASASLIWFMFWVVALVTFFMTVLPEYLQASQQNHRASSNGYVSPQNASSQPFQQGSDGFGTSFTSQSTPTSAQSATRASNQPVQPFTEPPRFGS